MRRKNKWADQELEEDTASATVEEDILPMQVGQVKLNGQMWSAVCRENETVSRGNLVEVKAIEGVKLVVAPAEKN